MSAYNPPNFNLPIFDSQAFIDVNTSEFLEFPTAQGLETFPNGLIGSLTGNATSASTITTANSNENLTHFLNFSNSSSTGVGIVQKTGGLFCNPSANTISATTFIGDCSGNAVTSTSSTSSTTATNIAGGLIGAIPYQSSANTTALLANISTNANMVLCSTGDAVPAWRNDFSNVTDVINNAGDTTRPSTSGDYYKLILFRVTCVVTLPASPPNGAYIRFAIRGVSRTLTIIPAGGTVGVDNIVVLTTLSNTGANMSLGVTLMYSNTANFVGWFVVQ